MTPKRSRPYDSNIKSGAASSKTTAKKHAFSVRIFITLEADAKLKVLNVFSVAKTDILQECAAQQIQRIALLFFLASQQDLQIVLQESVVSATVNGENVKTL